MRDAEGRGSVGFVDLDPHDPSRVLRVSERPALAPAAAGSFAADGVVPTAVVRDGDLLRLYYAGYRRREDVRFQAFCGLAFSDDDGETFRARSDDPVLPPSREGRLFRAIHSIRKEDGRWRAWYGAGSHFRQGETKTLPVYDIRHIESPDGIAFPDEGTVCIPVRGEEHRVGRPWVLPSANGYEMYFGAGTEREPYRLAYATSDDGIHWRRDDAILRLGPSQAGWDSEMIAYPAVVSVAGRTYLFYNGNGYGRDGFGYAIRTDAP
jgi:sucrose-6-phosphate hydrolase SacC (GH32 family)